MSPKYVGFGEAVKLFFSNYVNFSARSTRSEYWYATLFGILISIPLSVIDSLIGVQVLSTLWFLAVLIPGIALSIRRLHDTGRSGWWLLINLISLVGPIVFLVFTCQASDGANQYGEPAKL